MELSRASVMSDNDSFVLLREVNATYFADLLQDDYISKASRQIIENVCYAGLTTACCLVGIPANVLNALVFWRQGLEDRVHVCLFSLSLVDLCYLLCSCAIFTVSALVRLYQESLGEEYYTKVFVALGGLWFGFLALSGCIGMVVVLDRCACVAFPLQAPGLMKGWTMGVVIVTCFLVIQGAHLVYLAMFRAAAVRTGDTVRWVFLRTDVYRENMEIMGKFAFTFLGTALHVCLLAGVCVATAVTVVKLRAAIAWRGKTSSASGDSVSQQVALTKMLVILSLIYVVTVSPFVARQLGALFFSNCLGAGRCYELLSALSALAYGLLPVNSAIYFFVYCRRSTRFRQALSKLCAQAVGQPFVRSNSTRRAETRGNVTFTVGTE